MLFIYFRKAGIVGEVSEKDLSTIPIRFPGVSIRVTVRVTVPTDGAVPGQGVVSQCSRS